ncbi:UDP-N-acetylglucosamine 2-epimerase (non-hydrolyzing) [Victivallis vadensis]|uniref:UDP-N-acetylglucosamine 2-epimerase (Non-hydrolyzing) n=1 Tax=Victivallis vadensis TaxID=172901 RepID=A0A848B550_9BACT|nr:UDP-N-acetylglucosamine 2-epimerase (non-hydrolyzing) [Victivallis vadensis]NMD88182.1 UDP-N-acetylglucosamine 2-epimerase (non-hydrolyzing) [Victivallis vadensis]
MEKSKLKVMSIVGTRPEIIRLAAVIKLLEAHVDHKMIHTGQNYDYELNQVFFEELELRKPDYYLGVDTSSLGHVLGETLIKVEEVFNAEQPDAVLILGDTNAAIAGIMAKRMKIPIFHMEAGNRSFDLNVPEEINRRIIDHIADFNLVYTENSRRHLLAEGLPHRHIYVTGSPMYEVLHQYMDKIRSSKILDTLKLEKNRYFIVSCHREENVDYPSNLRKILAILNRLAETYDMPVVVSTHPRTRKRIEALEGVEIDSRVQFLKPFGFFDYNALQLNARCAISDSGTISEESSMLNFPAVTIRQALERPEAMDAGTIILTGLDPEIVLDSVRLVIDEFEQNGGKYEKICPEYQVPNTSWRVLKLILGTARLSNRWRGIELKK